MFTSVGTSRNTVDGEHAEERHEDGECDPFAAAGRTEARHHGEPTAGA